MWDHKDVWISRFPTFTVEISKHEVNYSIRAEGKNRWCVYIYVFRNHPLFSDIRTSKSYQPALDNIPFHGGCTFLKKHYDGTVVEAKQIGCDYSHCGDERFYEYSNLEEAYEVVADAKRLIQFMQEYKKLPTNGEEA